MWIDTHNHLSASCFDEDRDVVVERAIKHGVEQLLITPGSPVHFSKVIAVAHRYGSGYALGIHPFFVNQGVSSSLELLREAVKSSLSDNHFIAIGECGLDGTRSGVDSSSASPQVFEQGFRAQLKLAHEFNLPLTLHARGAIDTVYKYLRRVDLPGGVIHAFNGSLDQAKRFLSLGFKLGYGGALTYEGSKRIRRIAAQLPEDAWVLETDCPDMPSSRQRQANPDVVPRNEPAEIADYGRILAELRGVSIHEISEISRKNSFQVFPRLKFLPKIFSPKITS